MTLLSPWFLLGLIPVAVVAAWTMFRPGRQFVVVSSLSLWRKAQDAMSTSSSRPARRVALWWLVLLGGAVLGVLALARPALVASVGRRRIAVAVYPSAELSGEGPMNLLRESTSKLLDRLSDGDEVQLLLPDMLGGGAWVSPAEAKRRIAAVTVIAVRAGDLTLPAADVSCDRVYRFAPAGASIPDGPRVSVIQLPTYLGDVTLEALAAEQVPDGSVQLFVAVRNNSGTPRTVSVTVSLHRGDGSVREVISSPAGRVEGGARREWIVACKSADAFSVSVTGASSRAAGPWQVGYLLRRETSVRKVALIGPDQPLVRRFVNVHPGLQLTGDVSRADIVIANSDEPPEGVPALLINPPRPPAGWRRGKMIGPILLGQANLAADDPVMKSVSLSGLAVRRCAPWIASDSPAQLRLVSSRAGALVLRTRAGAFESLRRVYVAFDLSAENTNFSMSESFVVFLSNAVGWLGGDTADNRLAVRYEYTAPLSAYRQPTWQRVSGLEVPSGPSMPPWPGLYRDASGELHAVSLPGLRAEGVEISPTLAAESAPLPDPRQGEDAREFWSVLVAAAGAMWIIAWALRLR